MVVVCKSSRNKPSRVILVGVVGTSWDNGKAWLEISSILYKVCTVDFAVHFDFAVSFHSTRCDNWVKFFRDVISLNQSIFFLLAILTDEFCINNRLRQISLIVSAIFGKGRLSSHIGRFQTWKVFFCISFLLYFIKQLWINVAVRLLRNRLQNTSTHGKNIDETPGYRLVCHFFLLTTIWGHLWSITGRTLRTTESIWWIFYVDIM